jgi:hypothetical protein
VLRINKSFGLQDFEEVLALLARGETRLQLAHEIKAEAVGSTAALLQLLVTWGRKSEAELKLHVDAVTDPALRTFAETPAGLVAFNMARSIVSRSGEPIARREALGLAETYVGRMHGGTLRDLRHNNTIALLCLDNARHLGRPARLYDLRSETVRPSRDLADFIQACLEALTISRPRLRDTQDLVGPAAEILFEAFQNTHEHARVDFQGDLIPRSTRGVLIGWRYVAYDQLAAAAEGYASLERYFANWHAVRPDVKFGQFVELSVFDSGSGLAQTWLAKHGGLKQEIRDTAISLAAEVEAVHACLSKGGTTKSNRSAGNGLYRILSLASRCGGFVRLRTGRLSLGRAFIQAGHLDLNDVKMEDLRAGGVPAQPQSWAEGTVLTIMLPLNPERRS